MDSRFPGDSRAILRDARHEELPEVAGLLADSYREYEKLVAPGVWNEYLADIKDVGSRLAESELIVAEIDGRIAGAVTLYSRGSKSLPWPEEWAGVRLLGVIPSHRFRGIGRRLMDECVRRCRERGKTAIGLHTTEAMDRAKRMYERMGFVRVPEYDFHPAPQVIVMAYALRLCD